MACEAKLFTNITPEVYDSLEAEFKALTGKALGDGTEEGTLEVDGITFDYVYDEQLNTLNLQVVKKPFYLTCNMVEAHVQGVFDELKLKYPSIAVSASEPVQVIKDKPPEPPVTVAEHVEPVIDPVIDPVVIGS
jgi:hypothetical protein